MVGVGDGPHRDGRGGAGDDLGGRCARRIAGGRRRYVLRDVRREREVERLKGEFLANIFELRTPLSPIKGYSQLLRSRDPAGGRPAVRRGDRAVLRPVERVVGQLVDFASMSARGLELRTEAVVVGDLLDGVVARWTDRVEPGRHVARRLDGALPAVWVDRTAIDQALDELVDNAVTYSPDGGPILLNAPAARTDGGDVVCLAVVDRGIGILADRLDEVLGDFTQADGSATRVRWARPRPGARRLHRGRTAGRWRSRPDGGAGTAVTMVPPVGGRHCRRHRREPDCSQRRRRADDRPGRRAGGDRRAPARR